MIPSGCLPWTTTEWGFKLHYRRHPKQISSHFSYTLADTRVETERSHVLRELRDLIGAEPLASGQMIYV